MHLYVIARGTKPYQDTWVNDLLSKYVPYNPPKNVKAQLGLKEGEKGLIQLGVRPIQLYEIVFPDDQLDEVLKTVKPELPGYEKYKFLKGTIKMISKMLGLKPVPKWKDDGQFRILNQHVAVHAVGIKEDRKDEDGCELL